MLFRSTAIGLEGPRALLDRLCGSDRQISGFGLLLIGAVDSAGALLPSATIRVRAGRPYLTPSRAGRGLTAPRLSVGAFGTEWETLQSEGKGAAFCRIPRGIPLEIFAQIPGAGTRGIRLDPDSAAIREVLIPHPD